MHPPRRLAVLVVSLALIAPWGASAAGLKSEPGREAASQGLAGLWGWLTRLWTDNGCGIDPNGCAEDQGDNGCGIDPGGCAGTQGDNGCGADPDGCGDTAGSGDNGCGADPAAPPAQKAGRAPRWERRHPRRPTL
ncbi:MAG TPA: hypothetical protein VF756_06995 [Thermoanaerobaculia bacterium]